MDNQEYSLKFDKVDEQNSLPYLDNKLGITDIKEMLNVEYKVTAIKALELYKKGILQKLSMDFNGLKYIHKYLFEDLYPWAGQIRSINMSKGGNTFYYVENIISGIKELFANLKKDNYLQDLTTTEFVELFAYYSTELNVLHPFREGNGRAKRLFLTELARRAGYDLDLDKLDPIELRNADIMAFGSINDRLLPNLLALKVLYAKAIKPIGKIFSTNDLTKIQQLNRVLWVYDRERYNCWQHVNLSMKSAEIKLKQMLQTKEGRNSIITYLQYAMKGAKPKKVIAWIKNVIDELSMNNNNEKQNEKNL